MCGITGYISPKPLDAQAVLSAMSESLSHRGPDASGVWTDPDAGLGLGHRRLAIIDLSPSGEQPMVSASGRYVIVFNGEVYNFDVLRRDLDCEQPRAGFSWRGTSDTEVVLQAFDRWGFQASLERLAGMFAFALWDRRERKLHLVRDRMGEKPLYYATTGSSFFFGSEIKALRAFPDADFEIDPHALSSFLQFGYVPAPMSIYRDVHKVIPGSYVTVSVAENGSITVGEPRRHWSLNNGTIERRISSTAEMDDDELVDELHARLSASVRRQMVADVPLGAFLSGGIDSSTVVALMQTHSHQPIRTFTIGFHEQGYNEAPYAKKIARHLGTNHTEFYVGPGEAAAVIPRLPLIFDEPFADSSGIPTFLVSQLTRKHVTVSLSGDGGDELFAGYPRYQFCRNLWKRLSHLPRWSRAVASGLLTCLPPRAWDNTLGLLVSSQHNEWINGHRIHRLARVLCADTFDEFYRRVISQWHSEDNITIQSACAKREDVHQSNDRYESTLNRMRRFDIKQYLSDDLLTKVDRASMSVSLESRAPFLDHNLVEFAWALPERALIRNGEGKWILRQLLYRYVPRTMVERPKSGFAIPIARWLRTELREWAEHLLDEETIRRQGYFDPAPIRRMWREHCSGQFDRHTYLWSVLMFQAWVDVEWKTAAH